MSSDAPPPTGVIHRFALFIEGLKRAMAEGIRPREDALAAIAVPLWNYLSGTLRRLAALHARFAAGTLAAAPRRRTAPRPAPDHPGAVRRLSRIPPGPVLARYRLAAFAIPPRELVEHPEMRALLAAAPQAGRLLRPLWRKLTTDPLPEVLQLPRQPKAKPKPKPARTARAALPEPPPAASTRWEPSSCFPPWPPPLVQS